MLNKFASHNNEHVALSSDEIRVQVDDTSFPHAMRIMAENKTEFPLLSLGFAALGTLH